MVGLRKASAYSKMKVTPFTRTSKKRQQAFIKVVPPQKIVKFEMGKKTMYKEGKLPHVLNVVTTEKIQIRHNAFEACRQYVNKQLDRELNGQYMFKVVPYPHHIQREHRMLTGAGADRMSSGMQLSFGKSLGKAAIMSKESVIFRIALPSVKAASFARKVVKRVNPKLPCKIRIDYSKIEGKPKA